MYAAWLARGQAANRAVAVYARVADPRRRLGEAEEFVDDGVRVRLVVNNFVQRNPLSRNTLHDAGLERDFGRFLDDVQPRLVHAHHLAGHSIGLLSAVANRGLPLVCQLQDWWPACARSNLLMPDRSLCTGPSALKCARCIPLTGIAPASVWNPLLHVYRRRLMKRRLRLARAYVAGSRYIVESYRRLGLLEPDDRVHVIPYGVPLPETVPPRRRPTLPLRFGFVGTLMPHKGAHVAVGAFRDVDPRTATLDVWGKGTELPDYVAELKACLGSAVRLRGEFEDPRKAEVYSEMDVLIVPSLGLESFGLVAREAMSFGVPVIASRLGALAEQFEDGRSGRFFEAGDMPGLRGVILGLVQSPDEVARWAGDLPPVKGLVEHQGEIDAVYAQVLAG
jgi:glycosyltransferase involved in cell wall biosynthesis